MAFYEKRITQSSSEQKVQLDSGWMKKSLKAIMV
jgi:hypothetical protein